MRNQIFFNESSDCLYRFHTRTIFSSFQREQLSQKNANDAFFVDEYKNTINGYIIIFNIRMTYTYTSSILTFFSYIFSTFFWLYIKSRLISPIITIDITIQFHPTIV